MRIVAAVIGLLALVSVPAHAAWLVKLKTGEVLTVQSYWRDGDKTHLTRGGVDIIVDNDRIESMEDGAPEPETRVHSATARTRDGGSSDAAPSAAPAADDAAEAMQKYKERLADMPIEELQVEEEAQTNALLAAQAARFQAKHSGKTKEEVEALDKQFRQAQEIEWAAETTLKRRTVQQ